MLFPWSSNKYLEFQHHGVVGRNFYKGKAGSPYAIKDYYDICPDLDSAPEKRMKEFEALVRRTHKAGLKMLIDFVPNHVARSYHSDAKPARVKDLGENDDTAKGFSPQNNFYYLPGQMFSTENFEEDRARRVPDRHKSSADWCP